MVVNLLEWDSDFFNRAVAKADIDENEVLDISELIAACKKQDYKLLYIFIDSRNIIMKANTERILGEAINEKVVFEKKDSFIVSSKVSHDQYTVVNFVDKGTDLHFYNKITALAIKAGSFSRFWLDKKLESQFFFDLYRIWINNLVNDKSSRIIVANSNEGKMIGFISYKEIKKGFKIEFISVDEDYKKMGIGKMLLQKMYQEIDLKKIGNVIVESHAANTAAINFYISQGFTVKEAFKIYHIHL